MGSTCTWAAFQSVVMQRFTTSDSRQHMVLYLSLERQTLEPRTSASAVAEVTRNIRDNVGKSGIFIVIHCVFKLDNCFLCVTILCNFQN